MLQRRGGTQGTHKNLCCWQVQRFQGEAGALAGGEMKLCLISFAAKEGSGTIAKQEDGKAHKRANL